jgi:hypothetical protein
MVYIGVKMQNLTVKEAIEILSKFPQDAYIRHVTDIKLENRYEAILNCHNIEDEAYNRGYNHGKERYNAKQNKLD